MADGRGGRRDRWCAAALVAVVLWTGSGCGRGEDVAAPVRSSAATRATTTSTSIEVTTTTTPVPTTEATPPPTEPPPPPSTTTAPAPAPTAAPRTTTTKPPAPVTTAPPTTEQTPLGGPRPGDVSPGEIFVRTATPSYVIHGGANPMPAGFEAPTATSSQSLGCTRVGPETFLYRFDVIASGGRDWRMPPPPDGAQAGVHELRVDGLPGPFTVPVTHFWVLHQQGYPASRVDLPPALQLRILCS